jgi:hypothetical protein
MKDIEADKTRFERWFMAHRTALFMVELFVLIAFFVILAVTR